MAQIILIDDNQNMHGILYINLKTNVKEDVISKKNADELIKLMQVLPTINLVICRDKIGSEDTALKIFEHIQQNNLSTQMIVIGKVDSNIATNVITVEDNKDWEKVIKATTKILAIKNGELEKKVLPNYLAFPIQYFEAIKQPSYCDLYFRIKEGPGQFKFIKEINKGQDCTKSEISKYIQQGVKEIFVPKEEHVGFTEFMTTQLSSEL